MKKCAIYFFLIVILQCNIKRIYDYPNIFNYLKVKKNMSLHVIISNKYNDPAYFFPAGALPNSRLRQHHQLRPHQETLLRIPHQHQPHQGCAGGTGAGPDGQARQEEVRQRNVIPICSCVQYFNVSICTYVQFSRTMRSKKITFMSLQSLCTVNIF